MATETQQAQRNLEFTLRTNTFTRTGYGFSGWNTKSDGSGTAYSDRQENVSFSSDTKLYAQWTINQYRLTLVASPEAGGTVAGGGTFNYGTSRTVTATPAMGYNFASWSDGGAQSHAVTVTSNMSLTAAFAVQNYTVTFHRDMTNNNVTSITAAAGSSIAGQVDNLVSQISANSALIKGWQFDQWNVNDEHEDPYAPIQQSFDVYPIYKIRGGLNVGDEIPGDTTGTGSYTVGIAPTLADRVMPQGFYVGGDVIGHYRHNASPENHKIAMGVYIESQNGTVIRLTNNPTIVDSGEAHSIQPFSIELDKYQPISQDAAQMYFEASKVKPPACTVKWEVSAVAHLYLYPNI